jgi:hypothetical protein
MRLINLAAGLCEVAYGNSNAFANGLYTLFLKYECYLCYHFVAAPIFSDTDINIYNISTLVMTLFL